MRALCCLLLSVTLITVATGVFKLPQAFDAYQNVLRRTANRGDKVQIFQSIWGAIRVDFADDVDKSKELYTQISNFINNDRNCAEVAGSSTCELQQEVRRHLRKLAAQRLANLANADQNLGSYSMFLSSSIDPALVRDIVEHFIDDIYYHKPIEQLGSQLYQMYAENDEASYRMMIEAQLALHWKFQQVHDINDEYLFNAANFFNKIMTNHMYANVDIMLQRRVEMAYHSLPNSLQHLFATKGFCLWNKAHSEYLYTTVSEDFNLGRNGRHIFTWYVKNYTDNSALTRAFITEQRSTAFSKTTPTITLRGELYKWYYYLETSDNNLLAAWRAGSPTSTSSFVVKFFDNFLVFRQRDLTLCTDDQHDKERRRIRGLPGQLQMPPADACLWMATTCSSK